MGKFIKATLFDKGSHQNRTKGRLFFYYLPVIMLIDVHFFIAYINNSFMCVVVGTLLLWKIISMKMVKFHFFFYFHDHLYVVEEE